MKNKNRTKQIVAIFQDAERGGPQTLQGQLLNETDDASYFLKIRDSHGNTFEIPKRSIIKIIWGGGRE